AAIHHARRDTFDWIVFAELNRAFAIQRVAEHIHNAPDQPLTNGHGCDTPHGTHFVAFVDVAVFTQNDDTDVIGFQVEGDTRRATAEFYQFGGADVVAAPTTRHTVADLFHLPYLYGFVLPLTAANLFKQRVKNLSGDFRHLHVSL